MHFFNRKNKSFPTQIHRQRRVSPQGSKNSNGDRGTICLSRNNGKQERSHPAHAQLCSEITAFHTYKWETSLVKARGSNNPAFSAEVDEMAKSTLPWQVSLSPCTQGQAAAHKLFNLVLGLCKKYSTKIHCNITEAFSLKK